MTVARCLTVMAVVLLLAAAGCSNKPQIRSGAPTSADTPRPVRPGVYYKDDGPPASLPADIDQISEALPRDEPLHRFANRPYSVFGVGYAPMTALARFQQRGIASWYGRKFHGQKTAIGETYDMFAMTAAHPTLPLPSYVRVTGRRSGKSVTVRINDRGPFHGGRIIDLSYAAAHRIGIAQGGSGEVDIELLLPTFTTGTPAPTAIANVAPSPSPAPVVAQQSTPVSAAAVREGYFVQLGAFGNFANAQVFQQRMGTELGTVPRVQQSQSMFRVQLGPFATREAAITARDAAQTTLGAPLIITTSQER